MFLSIQWYRQFAAAHRTPPSDAEGVSPRAEALGAGDIAQAAAEPPDSGRPVWTLRRLSHLVLGLQRRASASGQGFCRYSSLLSIPVRLIEMELLLYLWYTGPRSIAFDGQFIYITSTSLHSLLKLGSGKRGTVKGFVYVSREMEEGWVLCVSGRLLHCKVTEVNNQKKYTFSFLSKQALEVSHRSIVTVAAALFRICMYYTNQGRNKGEEGDLGLLFFPACNCLIVKQSSLRSYYLDSHTTEVTFESVEI